MNKSPVFLNTERETRIFFWFMTLVLVGMSVWLIVIEPAMRQPLRLIFFTIVLIVHLVLHWMLRLFADRPGWTVGYMLVQGVLALVLVLLFNHIGVAFSVSMALVGEAIGVYGISKRGFLASAYYLVLSLGSFLFVFSPQQVGWLLLGAIPTVVFVVIYVDMYTRQANANERARELLGELEAANRQLTDYTAQVEDLTIATERQRMARELHDTLSQGLAGLILQLEAADAHLSGSRPEKARLIVQQTMDNARSTLANARRAIDNLRDGDSPGLEDAIRLEVSHFSAAVDIPCTIEIDLPTDIPPQFFDPIQRSVAEGLANIAQHAQATQSSVHLSQQEGTLTLEIHDNGIGFDPTAVPPGHYGLIGMSERARLAGGTLEIESQPGQGTTIKVKIPIP
jgi:NarL family two-component system sensor histidine kinase YdfH